MKLFDKFYIATLIFQAVLVAVLVIVAGDPVLIALNSALVGWGFAYFVFRESE